MTESVVCVAPVEWDEAGPCEKCFAPSGWHQGAQQRGQTDHAHVPPVSRVCGHAAGAHAEDEPNCAACWQEPSPRPPHFEEHAFVPGVPCPECYPFRGHVGTAIEWLHDEEPCATCKGLGYAPSGVTQASVEE